MAVRERPTPGSGQGPVMIVVCVALATVVAAMASLNVALPGIARGTRASQTQLAWVVDAYSLIFASLLLPAGAIGDRYGRRRALLVGLVVFGLGSAAAMTVSTANALILLRGVLGLGAALVMPATLSTITTTFPEAQRPRAVATWAGVAGGSAVIGLLATGLLLEVFSWRSLFGLNVVLAAAAIAGTLRFVPESADRHVPRLDVVGALLAVAGLVTLVYSVIEAPNAGWLSGRTAGGIAAGLGVLGGLVAWELRQAHPLLDPRLFRNRAFAAGTLSILAQFFAFFGFIFVLLQYLQLVRGDSALFAAVSMLPMAAAMMSVARRTPRLAARVGARNVCVGGLVLIATGLVVLSRLEATSSYWLIVGGLLPLGAGMGAAMAPATTAITEALPAAKQGIGSAMNDLARELGGALGIAVVGSVLAASYRGHLDLSGQPPALAEQARSSLAVASRLGGAVQAQAQDAFVSGLRAALLCAAAAAVLAAAGVAALLANHGLPASRPLDPPGTARTSEDPRTSTELRRTTT
ncbi:MFS transporter [Parafrankia discariae]|uniref:MFS transporter n=1 Tax=Parafrankia discariae TaxID=365528 RepID=UPI000684F4EF|nr:MFS transporter [Parafrankia discariae]